MVLEHNRFVVLNIIDFTVPLPRQDADITGDTWQSIETTENDDDN